MTDVTDPGALVEAAATGDPAAWSALVAQFSGLVWAVARAHGLRHSDAEDVYQTVWFRLAEHIGRLNEPERVGAWLATTARRECLRLIRIGSRLSSTGEPDLLDRGDPEPTPEARVIEAEEAADREERSHLLWQAFQELSERCRRLLRVLIASPPPSYAEIAAAFDMPIGSIGPTRARCLAQLRGLATGRGITGGA